MALSATLIPPDEPQPEPGYTTTEFWGKNAVQVVGLLVLFHVVNFSNEQVQGLVSAATLIGPEVAYAFSRGIRKRLM